MRKALFIDRDGVINDNKKPVNKPKDLIIYENSKKALKLAYNEGYDLFVVTNQGGVELGYITEDDLDRIHNKLKNDLKDYCKIKEIKYCPFYNRKSENRKPKPGMILDLLKKYDIDIDNSWMIGDMDTDITAGIKAGCKTAKIGKVNPKADINGNDLLNVVKRILDEDKNK
ncbi:MAG: HAD-IIIA family hydrolase [Firmicutes bacterium]|nr:HAD-IIIA family hydrolase [Bacillota bacterium]